MQQTPQPPTPSTGPAILGIIAGIACAALILGFLIGLIFTKNLPAAIGIVVIAVGLGAIAWGMLQLIPVEKQGKIERGTRSIAQGLIDSSVAFVKKLFVSGDSDFVLGFSEGLQVATRLTLQAASVLAVLISVALTLLSNSVATKNEVPPAEPPSSPPSAS